MSLMNNIGEVLYGKEWKAELSRDLKVNRQTLHRYSLGTYKMNPSIFEPIMSIILERQLQLETVKNELKNAIKDYENRSIQISNKEITVLINSVKNIQINEIDISDVTVNCNNESYIDSFKLLSVNVIYSERKNKMYLVVEYKISNISGVVIKKSPHFPLENKLSIQELVNRKVKYLGNRL